MCDVGANYQERPSWHTVKIISVTSVNSIRKEKIYS